MCWETRYNSIVTTGPHLWKFASQNTTTRIVTRQLTWYYKHIHTHPSKFSIDSRTKNVSYKQNHILDQNQGIDSSKTKYNTLSQIYLSSYIVSYSCFVALAVAFFQHFYLRPTRSRTVATREEESDKDEQFSSSFPKEWTTIFRAQV